MRMNKNELLKKIAFSIEKGKVSLMSPHPSEMEGEKGTDELTREALDSGIPAKEILSNGLIIGMQKVGEQFRNNEIYLPDVLMAAKSMTVGMEHLEPYFKSGDIRYKGKIILGTVAGDLHDIGKKIVGMFFEGNGWEVIDCGVDVSGDMFCEAVKKNRPNAVGLIALLTTTMVSMEGISKEIKLKYPGVKVIIGGAPVTTGFAAKIGADAYFPGPQGALDFLNIACKKNKTG